MAAYADGYWWSNDGLRLHYRDYAGPEGRPPILCIPGLTRNARDYEDLAARLAGEWRLICVNLRGRGESAYAKDSMTYVPITYAQDIEKLIAELGIGRMIAFGTSLGGIVTMLLAANGASRFAGVLLNDVGPVIEKKGLERIRGYVGRAGAWPTWIHAARAIAELNAGVYPGYAIQDWLRMAKRLCRVTPQGRIVPDYDGRIAEPFRLPGGETGIDLWPAFAAMRDIPALIVRGELSDVLGAGTLAQMEERLSAAKTVTIPRVGHAPTLDEPPAVQAIDGFLAGIVRKEAA